MSVCRSVSPSLDLDIQYGQFLENSNSNNTQIPSIFQRNLLRNCPWSMGNQRVCNQYLQGLRATCTTWVRWKSFHSPYVPWSKNGMNGGHSSHAMGIPIVAV